MAESKFTPSTRILVVEDSTEYALVLQRMLGKGLGLTDVTVVKSPEEALVAIRDDHEKNYDILFVDYHYPTAMSGGDLVTELRREGKLKDKVAFFMTAEPDVEKALEATRHGLAGIVVKPFDSDQLKLQLSRAHRDLEMARVTYADD